MSINTNHLESGVGLGNLLLQKEEYKRAIKYFTFCLKSHPENSDVLYGTAVCKFRISLMNRLDSSKVGLSVQEEEELKEQIRIQPEVQASINFLKQSIQQTPNHLNSQRMLGEIYLRLKNYDKSQQHLRKALQINPEDPETLIWMGKYMHVTKDNKASLKYFKQAKELAPKDSRILRAMGRVYYEINDFENSE